MSTRKPIPKSQKTISQESISPLLSNSKSPINDVTQNRALNRSVKNDNIKQFSVGLKDIDETIVYYFNNIIKPSVIQNNKKINVPILYGSPERWASVQKDGFYRDKNGKIQCPLIMFKRTNIQKNRNIGNKMDANNPLNFGIFEKRFSKKNVYDRFSILNNREPIKEYYGVIIPDYVNITYTCIIFTDYIEQMNKIVESINFASDAYWGDPERFRFRAMIDSYTTSTELSQGEDRKVRTEFTIDLLGHIVSDSINSQLNGLNKFFSKSSVSFGIETAGSVETLVAKAGTPEKSSSRRFFDKTLTGASTTQLTAQQISYLAISNVFASTDINNPTAVFANRAIITPPIGFSITQSDFDVYINGVLVDKNIRTVSQSGSDVIVTFNTNELGYELSSIDQVIIVGKVE